MFKFQASLECFRGHWRVVNWPNFGIVVSQWVACPKRGRDRMASWWNSHIQEHLLIQCAVLYEHGLWRAKKILIVILKIADHHNKCNNNDKFEILWDQNLTQRQRANTIKKNSMDRLACIVKAMVFPVVKYRCESWTVKKAECWRIDAFELWCWRRLLRVP